MKASARRTKDCPRDLELLAAAVDLDLEAASEKGEKLPTFTMTAYSGGGMHLAGWLYPVVIDLKGLKVSRKPRPILKEHDRAAVVGHSTGIDNDGSRLAVAGIISGTGPAAQEILSTARNGFPWRASVGARADKMIFVEANQTVEANGKTHKGPVYVAKRSTLGEISFVALAADDETSARVRASAGDRRIEVTAMNFEEWLTAKGWDPDALSDDQRSTLEAAWKAEQEPEPKPEPKVDPPAPKPDVKATAPTDVEAAATAAAEKAVEDERDRVAKIEAAVDGFEGDRVQELRAQAMSGQITLDDLRAGMLTHVRDSRAQHVPGAEAVENDRKVLLATGYQLGGVPDDRIVAMCGEQSLEAASRLRGIGLQEFCARAALLEGVQLPRYQNDASGWLQAGFSTMTLPGILGAVANKSLLEAYSYVEDVWRQVVKIASVKNFLQHNRYRLTSDFKFEKVAADGELKHGELAQQAYTQQADTYGIMFALTRQAIINDDLGAFLAVPQQLGLGAGEAIAEAVWTLLLSNPSSFFHADNSNLETGAGSALSIAGLTAAELAFLNQTKPNGRPLGVAAKKLLVPPALKVTAEQLMESLELNETTTANVGKGKKNVHAGKFDVVCSTYLSNATITGYSATAWYLFADPRVLAALEVAFLNGVDRPTVEKADADFNTLGVQFRGYIDFGVKEQDPRGAVKSDGV